MGDLLIRSTRGGQNTTDDAISIPDDQLVAAENVEWTTSMCGERRRGCEAVDITGSVLASLADEVVFLHRHLPTSDERESELWALGILDDETNGFEKLGTTGWYTVGPIDAVELTGDLRYRIRGQSLHGKLFLAFKSDEDRLHVWDGVMLRRVGQTAQTTGPTVDDTMDGGSFTSTRYYRVRYIRQVDGVTILRSEPSETTTFEPDGGQDGAIVTKPDSAGEAETHWELEASLDLGDWYRIGTATIATSTQEDNVDAAVGYALTGTLSEDIGDYDPIPSAEFLTVDEDRLLFGGSFEDSALAARVGWTPVFNAPGVGNDERSPLDEDNSLDLDAEDGGGLTGLSEPINGYVHAFKLGQIFRLVRTYVRARAYKPVTLTKQRGALRGSVISGFDQSGDGCLYFLDPKVGPCRLGTKGLQTMGRDIKSPTWESVNINAASLVCHGVYDNANSQVKWWVATDDSDTPDLLIVLHVNNVRDTVEGGRRGWAIWTGPIAHARASCLYAENVADIGDDRSLTLVPIIGMNLTEQDGLGVEVPALMGFTNTGFTDFGVGYVARMLTKPFTLGNWLHQWGVMKVAAVVKQTGHDLLVKLFGDFVLAKTATVDTPSGDDTTIVVLDDLSVADIVTAQLEIRDTDTPTGRWELQGIGIDVKGAAK